MASVELDVEREHAPVANWALAALIFLCYYGQWLLSKRTFDALTLTTFDPVSLVTYAFLHVHLLHLAWNLMLLWFFGNLLCGRAGGVGHVLVFLGCGVGAGLAHVAFGGPQVVGASGAVRGVAGCVLILLGRNKLLFFDRSFACPLWVIIAALIVKDLTALAVGAGSVSTTGHLGGMACGIAAGIVLRALDRARSGGERQPSSNRPMPANSGRGARADCQCDSKMP